MKTIFILDNDSRRQEELKHYLTAMGFRVQSFSAFEFGVTNDEIPFAVILDEKFMNGLPSIKKVRRRLSGAAVVFMKNLTDNRTVAEAIKAGAYAVLEKNEAEFVNLRTILDKLASDPPKMNWFARLTFA